MEFLRRCFAATILAMLAGRLLAAESSPEKIDLFHAGQGGFALYRIPGIVVTAKGTVLTYCEARRTGGDWADMNILLRRSTDGGKTWDAARNIAEVPGPKSKNPVRTNANPAEITYNNPVAISDRDGSVHLLFCLEYMRCFHQRSEDDGRTWSAPVEITRAFEPLRSEYDWKVVALGPGHGIQLQNGRLLVPAWLSLGSGRNNHSPSLTASLFSDDHGRSWKSCIAIPDSAQTPSPNETTAVQLADGHVLFNARSQTSESRRLVATSADGGVTWSAARPHPGLYEPVCMASLVRFPEVSKGGTKALLFSQPAPQDDADGKPATGNSRERKNLTIRLSRDEGETWAVHKTLEAGPSAYSDLAVLDDGTILCFYERGEANGKTPYAHLTVARFNLAWLAGEKPASPK
jgi:sialidase-1